MKTKLIATVALMLLPLVAFTQPQPNPPTPPVPPGPPPGNGPERHERTEKKVPVTYLGIETSDVPSVLSDQLGLAKGFGLVVDYVVPDSPAAAAGVQQNDIIKMLNDQILTEPDQLSTLIRSYSEGTTVTLTLLRKGKEEKVTAKLSKKEVPQGREPGRHRHPGFPFGDHEMGDFGVSGDFRDQMERLKEQIGDTNQGVIHDAVMQAQAAAQRVRDEGQRERHRCLAAVGELRLAREVEGLVGREPACRAIGDDVPGEDDAGALSCEGTGGDAVEHHRKTGAVLDAADDREHVAVGLE